MTQTNDTGGPSFSEALRTWAQIGLTSFGGPAGQIAMMHKILVDEKKWLEERTYLLALNFCTLLPGPEAMQLATYAGWRLHGVKGGLAAGLLFVMPGALVVLALSAIYLAFGNVPLVTAIFTGIKAAVLAVVIEALLRISRKSLKDRAEWLIAALSFIAIFFFKVPFPIIILAAALFGFWRGLSGPASTAHIAVAAQAIKFTDTLSTILLWLVIWIVPLAAIVIAFPQVPVFREIALFFSKLAVVTFGGAYAVLAYVAQDGVAVYGWLKPGEMLDGLGLAETTPGPLILVNSFVGYLGAARAADDGTSIVNGVIGWAIALWATFAPCFLWIFAGAPYVERIAQMPRLKSALSAITAAVVGVVLNLSVWFALHVLFRKVVETDWGLVHTAVPTLTSLDWRAAAPAVIAAVLLLRLHWNMIAVLGLCGALSLAISRLA